MLSDWAQPNSWPRLLRDLAEEAPVFSLVARRDAVIAGYSFGHHGTENFLGKKTMIEVWLGI